MPDSEHFYLTGGTALAHFYLRHRQSNDLDLFTSLEALVDPFSRRLEAELKNQGMEVTRQRGTYSFVELYAASKNQSTIIHLAQDAAFRLEPPREFPEYPGLWVDGLEDIASNKLLALYGRATFRDFIDIYCLIEGGHFTRQDLTAKAKRKDPGFDLYWLGVAFQRVHTFPKDSPEILLLVKPVEFEKLRAFFDLWRKEIATELKS